MEKSIIERALEIAASGTVRNIISIERRLSREGYEQVDQHLHGRAIRNRLNAMIRATEQGDPPVD